MVRHAAHGRLADVLAHQHHLAGRGCWCSVLHDSPADLELQVYGMLVPDTPPTVAQTMCGLHDVSEALLNSLCGALMSRELHDLTMRRLETLLVSRSDLQRFGCNSSRFAHPAET